MEFEVPLLCVSVVLPPISHIPLINVVFRFDLPTAALGVLEPTSATIGLDDPRAYFTGEDQKPIMQNTEFVEIADDRKNLDDFLARIDRDPSQGPGSRPRPTIAFSFLATRERMSLSV